MLLPQTLDEICSHAKAEFPDECCGVILQSESQEFVRKYRNIQNEMHQKDPTTYPRDARTAYLLHPDDLISVHKETDRQNRPIKAFYHSHPNNEAYFSEKDKSDATAWDEPTYPGISYIVISIYGDTVRVVKAFEWDEAKSDFIEVPVQTTPVGE